MRSLLLLLLLLTACGRSEAPPAETPPPAEVKADFLEVMHERLLGLTALEDALVSGDLKAARAAALTIDLEQIPGAVPESWEARGSELTSALKGVSGATELDSMAKGAAAAAVTCGACHESAGVKITFSKAKHPDRDEGASAHMARHRQAVALMREAIVGADDARWGKAMTWLAQGPVEDEEMGGHKLDDAAKEQEAKVHELAAQGQAAADAPSRATVYAELLVACASCHAQTGGGPD